MKAILTYAILCLCCFFMMSCADKSVSQSGIEHVQLDNSLTVPITQSSPTFFFNSTNHTPVQEDVVGFLTALLQSDYGIRLANTAAEADYVVNLEIESFRIVGKVDAPIDAATLALPILLTTASGAQLGSNIYGLEGSLYGAGIGLLAGLSIGLLAQEGEYTVWQMVVQVNIEHDEENFESRIDARVQGENMDGRQAAAELEFKVASAITKAFVKE